MKISTLYYSRRLIDVRPDLRIVQVILWQLAFASVDRVQEPDGILDEGEFEQSSVVGVAHVDVEAEGRYQGHADDHLELPSDALDGSDAPEAHLAILAVSMVPGPSHVDCPGPDRTVTLARNDCRIKHCLVQRQIKLG